MKVVFRVDSSPIIGIGHLMRCLTLGIALRAKGATCYFICGKYDGHQSGIVGDYGFTLFLLEKNNKKHPISDDPSTWIGDWRTDAEATKVFLKQIKPKMLIVDHYAIDFSWQKELNGYYEKLFVIDDLAEKKHLADYLLNQNYGSSEENYVDKVPRECIKFLGPQYALLREDFPQMRKFALGNRKKAKVENILINFGGTDPLNITELVLKFLIQKDFYKKYKITVIMGKASVFLKEVENILKKVEGIALKIDVKNMAYEMACSDLSIGAAGSSCWERCSLGLPTMLFIVAENQKKCAIDLDRYGAVKLVSLKDNFENSFIKCLDYFSIPQNYNNCVSKCLSITDGNGAENISNLLLGI